MKPQVFQTQLDETLRQTHESRNYIDGEEEPKHVAGWWCLVLFWGRVWHWWPEAHRRPAVASKPSSEFYHRGLRPPFAEDWCCRSNHTNRKERQGFGKWYCEMLDRAITNRGTDLKLKLCGCWMCFSWFPGRITVRNDLCQKDEWEKTKPCSYLFSKNTQFKGELPASSSHLLIILEQTTDTVVSKHHNSTHDRLLPVCLSNMRMFVFCELSSVFLTVYLSDVLYVS